MQKAASGPLEEVLNVNNLGKSWVYSDITV